MDFKVCAHSRTLEILLADWEISSNTQVKNRACVPCMAEQTGVHGVIFYAEGRTYVSDHALELIVPVLMPPRACAVHARHMHARRWHRMGHKCTPAAPNQPLTGIQALLMQSSCLFRRNTAGDESWESWAPYYNLYEAPPWSKGGLQWPNPKSGHASSHFY